MKCIFNIATTKINTIEVKVCTIVLINILLVAVVIEYYSSIDFNIDAEHLALVLLGGSQGIDAFLRFTFQIFIFILPFLIVKKNASGLLLFLIRVNIVLFWVDIVSVLVSPSELWEHIRGCAGGNFLTFSFSLFWLIRKRNFGPFLEALIGLLSPPIALYTVASGINNSFVSWVYFYD